MRASYIDTNRCKSEWLRINLCEELMFARPAADHGAMEDRDLFPPARDMDSSRCGCLPPTLCGNGCSGDVARQFSEGELEGEWIENSTGSAVF